MRVFLRLVYLGQVDSSDWADAQESGDGRASMLRQINMQVSGSRLTSIGDQTAWDKAAIFDNGGSRDFEFSVRSNNWEGDIMVGIAPLGAELCRDMHCKHGFYFNVENGSFTGVYAQDGTYGKVCSAAWPSNLPAGATFNARFQHGSLLFSVNDGAFATADFDTEIPRDRDYVPAVTICESDTVVEVLRVTPLSCPLDILLGVALLAKKYMVGTILSITTQVLKERVARAKLCNDVAAFEQLLASAISGDLGAVRMAALDSAKDFAKLRSEYDAGRLRPEVAHDLESIWPSPRPKPFKLACLS